MFDYVRTLDACDYQDWLCIPSQNSHVTIGPWKNPDWSMMWCLPCAISFWTGWEVEWGQPLVFLTQGLVAMIAVMAIAIADLCEKRLVKHIPVWLHFLLWGCSRKFKKSRWHPPPLPPFLCSLVCSVASLPLASIVIAALHIFKCKRRDWVE